MAESLREREEVSNVENGKLGTSQLNRVGIADSETDNDTSSYADEELANEQEPITSNENTPNDTEKLDRRTEGEEEGDEDGEEEEETEPTLKYAKLTATLSSIYRNGDSTSSFIVSSDKMLVGTHNGNVHVLSLPTFNAVRVYNAHSSSITAMSVSPYSATFTAPSAASLKPPQVSNSTPTKHSSSATAVSPPNSSRHPPVPATPSNSIHVATASMDGHVCVSSLTDPKDVTLRNFARPVHAIALSPAFRSDRTYLSGGTAGNLMLTVGGKAGVTEDASTNSAATAAAVGWLNNIGLGSGGGKDTILHAGEGTISSIKWSLSGKYVAWNNEYGTRIIRSHLHHQSSDSDYIWKRLPLGHIPRPNRKVWVDERAAGWKARTEWVDEKILDRKDATTMLPTISGVKGSIERLLIGWGDAVWMVHVHTEKIDVSKQNITPAKAEIVSQLRFPDCIVSGATLNTPSTLVVLLYQEIDERSEGNKTQSETTPRKGIPKRHNGMPPDLRLVDLATKQELENESLIVSRYESLSASDYSVSRLFVPSLSESAEHQRGTFEAIGDGLKDVGQGATRLLSSSVSILSGSSGGEKASSTSPQNFAVDRTVGQTLTNGETVPALAPPGLKIFIQSPFDCLVAIKRNEADRLDWLLEHKEFEDAWNLVNDHPEVVSSHQPDSRPVTPAPSGQSLADFFEDGYSSSQSTTGPIKTHKAAVEKQKQQIGDLWIQQLVDADRWLEAGVVAGKVLGNSPKWSDWILTFAQAGKFDEITPYIPSAPLKPALQSYVYEAVLGHYIVHDKLRVQKLVEQWDSSLFDIPILISAIEEQLDGSTEQKAVEAGFKTEDERLLLEVLATLHVANNNPSEAIRCYVRIRNSDAVLDMIREYHMIMAIEDVIFTFILIQITPNQRRNAPMSELDDLSLEPVRLLATAATQGIVSPDIVISQLEKQVPLSKPYMFFYLRTLWQGDIMEDSRNEDLKSAKPAPMRRSRFTTVSNAELMSRSLIAPHADLAVSLFAEYSQPLLNEFLKSSQDYSFTHASEECRRYHHTPELVYLLSVTGQTSDALRLIIDELDDVEMAIDFARDSNEQSLWEDLINYSMDKPKFIRGLLEEASGNVDPVTLVQRIPQGKAIPGLKESLSKVLKEKEATWSITETATKVLSAEVGKVLQALRRHRERGLAFDATQESRLDSQEEGVHHGLKSHYQSKHCASCQTAFKITSTAPHVVEVEEHLIGFSCGHLFHLTCILDDLVNGPNKTAIDNLQRDLATDMNDNPASHDLPGRVGTKMRHAQMIQQALATMTEPNKAEFAVEKALDKAAIRTTSFHELELSAKSPEAIPS